jgi:hypothetical protein
VFKVDVRANPSKIRRQEIEPLLIDLIVEVENIGPLIETASIIPTNIPELKSKEVRVKLEPGESKSTSLNFLRKLIDSQTNIQRSAGVSIRSEHVFLEVIVESQSGDYIKKGTWILIE